MKHNTLLTAIISIALLVAASCSVIPGSGIASAQTTDEEYTEALAFAAAILGGIPGACVGCIGAPIIGPFAASVVTALIFGVLFLAAFFVVLSLIFLIVLLHLGT